MQNAHDPLLFHLTLPGQIVKANFERFIMIEFIDFYAEWCGPCQAMKPVIDEVEGELEGKVSFRKVDVEKEGQLAQKYGIMSIPTFVLQKDDKEIDRKMGAMPKSILVEWINSHLEG